MAVLKIHGLPPSTFTRTVRLACHEKGIEYEMVDAMPNTIDPLNPFGKIPAITHDGVTLFESIAILRYLERAFPGPKLWDQWASAVADSLVNASLRYFAARAGFLPVPAEMAQKYLAKTAEVVPIFDRQLGKHRFLAGDSLTVADLYLYPLYAYFPDIAELKAIADRAPNCNRWSAEMAARPSVKATEPSFKPQIAA
ncbi:MAG: glutathione S-transferase family protein [Alphaproteobacteria bacterium]|nr:MAG: glutathione S-transferase family protein [Alphaproteobacteria bacterium]